MITEQAERVLKEASMPPIDTPVTVRFPRHMYDHLIEVAEEQDRSLASLVRHITRCYLDRTDHAAGAEHPRGRGVN